ncbi:unnamed protein product [Cuscuta epithymum]|uniref:Uncharacterized protein n=1 Tax=Cuscuta epithymum TaxID=186058 RepID=A0AAV0EAN3_9ASTE|nr:unnamed protein product [Cuscuta epithymum]
MVHDKKPCMGSIIASIFHRQSMNHIQVLYTGSYITRILYGMGYGDQFRNMEVSSSFLPLTILPSMNTGLGARLQRETEQTEAAATAGVQGVPHRGGIQIIKGGGASHDDEASDEEMDDAAQDMPYVPPPFGQTFPDTWGGNACAPGRHLPSAIYRAA